MILDDKRSRLPKSNRVQATLGKKKVKGGLEGEEVKGGFERGRVQGRLEREGVRGEQVGRSILRDTDERKPTNADKEIAAWREWMEETYPATEYAWYMITLMFNELSGNREAKLIQMEREADLIYNKILTRIVRDPRSELYLPFLIMHPDLPVPKKGKSSLENVTINAGLHLSGIYVIPKRSRLKGQSLDEHVCSNPGVYKSHGGKIRRIHIVPIDRTPKNVVSYCFKTLKREWIESGNTFIWPKAKSELSKAKPSTLARHTTSPASAHI